MPENLSPAEQIKQVEKRLKGAPPKLELEDKDAKGLSGDEERMNVMKNLDRFYRQFCSRVAMAV